MIKTNFLGDEVPKESEQYTCIACITIDSVIKMKKKQLSGLFRECKYRMKKAKMTRFIETELKSETESELESDIELELKSDTK